MSVRRYSTCTFSIQLLYIPQFYTRYSAGNNQTGRIIYLYGFNSLAPFSQTLYHRHKALYKVVLQSVAWLTEIHPPTYYGSRYFPYNE